MLFYSCNSADPLLRLNELHAEFTARSDAAENPNVLKILVGCRKDLSSKENTTLISNLDKFAKTRGYAHFITSSKMNTNVDAVG